MAAVIDAVFQNSKLFAAISTTPTRGTIHAAVDGMFNGLIQKSVSLQPKNKRLSRHTAKPLIYLGVLVELSGIEPLTSTMPL